MSGSFDPYYTWLGIPPAESAGGGPHHYRLLGLQLFESNPSVIDHAADRLMIHLRTLAGGPQGPTSQRLLGEVTAARICLLDPKLRATYDAQLRSRLASTAAPSPTAAAPRPVVARPLPVAPIQGGGPQYAAPLQPVPLQPIPLPAPPPAPPPASQPPAYFQPALEQSAPVIIETSVSPRRTTTTGTSSRRKADAGTELPGTIVGIVKVVLGALGGLSLALLIVWIFFRSDPLGLFGPDGGKQTAKNQSKNATQVKTIVIERPAGNRTNTSAPDNSAATSAQAAPDSSSEGSSSDAPSNPAGPTTSGTGSPPAGLSFVRPAPVASVTPAPAPAAERLQPPTTAEQKAKLDELKEAFESEFEASTRPGTREAFPDFLLEAAEQMKSDSAARFVLFREAFTRLIATKEFDAAVEVVDRLEQEFVLDPFNLRMHTLTKASEAAKLPAEKLTIVLCAADLAEIAVRRQRLTEALSLARMADVHARSLPDGELKNRIGTLRVDVEQASSQWAPVQRARQTLTTEPENAAAATVDGRYRCLVEGDWQQGLALLARGTDEQLAAAAKNDLAGVGAELGPLALGDNWHQIAESDERLKGFYARARHWYALAATESAADLDRARAKVRIESIDAMKLPERLLAGSTAAPAEGEPLPSFVAMYMRNVEFQPVDLFKFVVPKELLDSPWDYDQNSNASNPAILSDPAAAYGKVAAHFKPPREYQMSLQVSRPYLGGSSRTPIGPLVVGLMGPRKQFAAVIDLPLGQEFVSLLSVTSAKSPDANATLVRHSVPLISPSSSAESIVVCQVRRKGVAVLVNGREACRFEGNLADLSLPKGWDVTDENALMLGAQNAAYQVRRWRLEPLPKEAPPAARVPFRGQDPNAGQFAPGFGQPAPMRPTFSPSPPGQRADPFAP